MTTISNKTNAPLTIPLAQGKKLHLAPGKEGQITPKTLERPAVKALIEKGEIEVSDAKGKARTNSAGPGGSLQRSGKLGGSGKAQRQSGDR